MLCDREATAVRAAHITEKKPVQQPRPSTAKNKNKPLKKINLLPSQLEEKRAGHWDVKKQMYFKFKDLIFTTVIYNQFTYHDDPK